MRLLEVLVALMVGTVLLLAAWTALARGAVAGRALVAMGEVLETHRLGLGVLDRELAGSRPGEDWSEHADGLALRAFRGWGTVCAVPGPERVVVEYRGLRRPEPLKDSVEMVRADGARTVVELVSASSVDPEEYAGCGAALDPVLLRWPLPAAGGGAVWRPQAPPLVVRVFERGLYAVDDAVRYRRGAGGRQPLTAAALDPDRSWFGVRGGVPVLEMSVGRGQVRKRRWAR